MFLSPYEYQIEINLGGQLLIWIQIHIWVVLFDLNLGSTLAQGPSVFHFSSLWWWWEGPLQLQSPLSVSPQMIVGIQSRSIFVLYFLTWIRGWGGDPLWLQHWSHLCLTWADALYWYYVNLMLSSEFNILSNNSIPSGQIWEILHKQGSVCIRWTLWVPSTVCYLQNWAFCPNIFVFLNIICCMSA